MYGRMFDDMISGLLWMGAAMGIGAVLLLAGLWWLVSHIRVEWVG